jgi:hypothetical protein
MKTVKLILVTVLLMAIGTDASAQTDKKAGLKQKTEAIKVSGACDMCKARIEKTALSEGATSAVWDVKTQILTVSFDPEKTSKDALAKKLASVGHDAENYRAPDDVYAKLPGCCHYERVK